MCCQRGFTICTQNYVYLLKFLLVTMYELVNSHLSNKICFYSKCTKVVSFLCKLKELLKKQNYESKLQDNRYLSYSILKNYCFVHLWNTINVFRNPRVFNLRGNFSLIFFNMIELN